MPNSCDSMDCCLPGYSVHGILQARILEWVVIPFARGSSLANQRSKPGLPHCRQILYHLSIGILKHFKINVYCCSKPLSLGTCCYTAVDN